MTMEPREERAQRFSPPHRLLWWIILFAGLAAALVLFLLGSLTLLLLDGGFQAELQMRQGIGMIGLGVGLIGVVVGMGWRLARNSPPISFFPRRTWPLWLVFLAVLVGGLIFSLPTSVPPVALAVLSTLTMMLLPALVLGAIGRVMEGRGGTWEDVLGGLVAGASVGTGAAAAIEAGVAVVGLLLFVGYVLLSGRSIDLVALIEQAEPSNLLTDPRQIAHLMQPLILLLLLFVFSVVVPLVEETAKTLGVGLLGRWLRPHPARAFLLGIASGAGFALAENVLNVSLFEGSVWIGAVASRLLATLMHSATGGLMGWGWGELWAARKPGRLALAYLGAVSVHGVWNGLAVMAALSGMALGGTKDAMKVLTLSTITGFSSLALLLLATFCFIGTVWTGRVLARRAA